MVNLRAKNTNELIQIAALEKEIKERAKKDSQKEQQEADAPIINPGGFGNRLMLTQGPANGYATTWLKARYNC
jgi:hypothetical protein